MHLSPKLAAVKRICNFCCSSAMRLRGCEAAANVDQRSFRDVDSQSLPFTPSDFLLIRDKRAQKYVVSSLVISCPACSPNTILHMVFVKPESGTDNEGFQGSIFIWFETNPRIIASWCVSAMLWVRALLGQDLVTNL